MYKEWEKTLLKKDNNMKEVLETLDRGALGIVLVIDNDSKLYGTITDGDVRRAILEGIDTNSSLDKFVNKKPITSNIDTTKKKLIDLMEKNGILQIPVVDEDNKISICSPTGS